MKDIKGYEEIYAVTSCGKVWSYRNKKFLSPAICGEYLKVTLCKNGKSKIEYVHKLVANAYIDNKNDFPVINHKDENKLNNNVNNLEWCTQSYNVLYSMKSGRNVKASKMCKCIELNKIFNGPLVASKALGIRYYKITRCCRNKNESVNGYHFEYV